ncbi:MAG: DUF4397 domain-containing protein [Mucilaginibacter sp.]
MKILNNISKKSVAVIGAVCILSAMLSSCIKSHTSDTPAPPVALLSVIQASPDQPLLDFSLDGTRVNLNSIAYGDDLDYFRAYAGSRRAAFSKNGVVGTSVISDTITLKQNVAYSLFLINKASTPQYLFLTDSLTQPTAGNANLRFVNVSPDAPAVDLAVKDGAVFVPNKAFKGHSSFLPIQGKRYTFEIRKAGTTTVLATLNNVEVTPGYVYTILFRGFAASTTAPTKLTADFIINARPY